MIQQFPLPIGRVDQVGGVLLVGADIDHTDRTPLGGGAFRTSVSVDQEICSDDVYASVAIESIDLLETDHVHTLLALRSEKGNSGCTIGLKDELRLKTVDALTVSEFGKSLYRGCSGISRTSQ